LELKFFIQSMSNEKLKLKVDKKSNAWPDARQTADRAQISEVVRSLATNETKAWPIAAHFADSALGHRKGGTILGWSCVSVFIYLFRHVGYR